MQARSDLYNAPANLTRGGERTVRNNLLSIGPKVINIGLASFAEDLAASGTPFVHVDWQPPRTTDTRVLDALDTLATPQKRKRVDAANLIAVERMKNGDPVLVDVRPAGEVIEGLEGRTILHAGPPIDWARMCGPMRGAIAGAAVFEGWATTLEEGEALAASGAIALHPNHHFDAVGPMTGLTTYNMPVMIVENQAHGNQSFCTINEGLGKVMRFGGNDASVIERLRWLARVLGPLLGDALRGSDGVGLKNIVARGLTMGDEMHQRNVACTSLLLRALAPLMATVSTDSARLAEALSFIAGNDQFFLNVGMAMGKAIMDPVRNIPDSSVVTAMCRNGTDFGIRTSGTGDTWFVAPVEMPRGLYFAGFSADDANPDMGDSTIVETIGLGGFAMAAAPAVAGFVGAGRASEAQGFTQRMAEITVTTNPEWTIPAMDYQGVPTGIDVRRVVAAGLTPTINTGIAHREPGVGQVGAGVVNAPLVCFEQALVELNTVMETAA
ncbi:MAG: DUF1116 domain-containing protein [Chromatiales bacterium]|jgi:hypothetical protein|nr:DUF1116 domain-containing protein [Chromatiales bacterium]